MLEDIRRRQMIFVPLLVGTGLLAGGAAGFTWQAWFVPWWYRGLACLVVIACIAGIISCLGPLREARRELRFLKRAARANRRGPRADPLQTARRDYDDGMGGFDIFDQRRGG
jgi:hypothetical protein